MIWEQECQDVSEKCSNFCVMSGGWNCTIVRLNVGTLSIHLEAALSLVLATNVSAQGPMKLVTSAPFRL